MPSWKTTTLEGFGADSKHAFSTGPFGSSISKKFFRDTGVPVIRGSNLSRDVDTRLLDEGLVFVDQEHAAKFERSHVRPGDLVFTCWGTIGQVGLIADSNAYSEYLISNKQMKMTPAPDLVDSLYLYYLLSSPRMIHEVTSQAIGTSVPGFNLGQLKNLVVNIPDLQTQKRISAALASFDDLIENNRRRIEILEEMARLLYREWFVHFRFPGHEDVEMVDSELGPIPDGWVACSTSDAFEAVGGGTPSKKQPDYWTEGDIQWFTPSDLTRAGEAFMFRSQDRINSLGLEKSSAKLFPAGSVMMTSRATVGVVAVAAVEGATNQGFITCIPNERVSTEFLYLWLESQVPSFLTLAGGATFKELRKSDFRSYRMVLPDRSSMERFNEASGPVFELISNLVRQNKVLREARDLLLPRLVSGELDVSELDLEGVLA